MPMLNVEWDLSLQYDIGETYIAEYLGHYHEYNC